MRAIVVGLVFLASVGAVSAQKPQPVIGPSPGGTYTLTFDRNKPIAVTSITFSDPDVNAFGNTKGSASQVFVTISSGFELLPALARGCETGRRFGKVIATYTNRGGHVEFTVELRKVSVDSLSFPGIDRAATRLEDFGWTLSAEDEHFDYNLMRAQGNDLSEGNRKRLEQAHDRVEAILWLQVRRQGWHAPERDLPSPPGSAFSLVIGDLNTNGVRGLGPFAIESETDKEKSRFPPLTLSIDSTRAADFTDAIKANKQIPSSSLTYYRTTEDDQQVEIRILLKGVTLKAEPVAEGAEPKTTLTVALGFEAIEIKVS